MPLVYIIMRIINKIGYIETEPIQGFICTFIVALILVPLIKIVNKHFSQISR